jgi:hypothetical protein
MPLSNGKRRYNVSLNPEVVKRFQTLARELGMPPVVMSLICEDALKQSATVFQIQKSKGKFSFGDLLRLQGQQLDLMENEEKEKKNVSGQKRDSVPDKKKHG